MGFLRTLNLGIILTAAIAAVAAAAVPVGVGVPLEVLDVALARLLVNAQHHVVEQFNAVLRCTAGESRSLVGRPVALLGDEAQVVALDVVEGVVLALLLARLLGYAQGEGADALELHLVALLDEFCHALLGLGQHADDHVVGVDGAVCLNVAGECPHVGHALVVYYSSVGLAVAGELLVVVSVTFNFYAHNVCVFCGFRNAAASCIGWSPPAFSDLGRLLQSSGFRSFPETLCVFPKNTLCVSHERSRVLRNSTHKGTKKS